MVHDEVAWKCQHIRANVNRVIDVPLHLPELI